MKKASRKVLADKTNSTPVSGLVPAATKSEKREGAEEDREASSPCMRGEDALRSQVVRLNNRRIRFFLANASNLVVVVILMNY